MRHFILSMLYPVLASTVLNAAIISDNFDSYTPGPGSLPGGAKVTTTAGISRSFIVGASTSPADPFAGVDNQSLLLEKTATGAIPRVSWNFDKVDSGTVTLTVYSVKDSTNFTAPLFRMYLYEGSAIGVAIGWAGDVFKVITSEGGTAKTLDFSNSQWQSNTAVEISLTFAQGAFSLTLNGEKLTTNDGQDSFAYRDPITQGFDKLEFAISDSANKGSRIFIDNLEVASIPEAPGVALAVIGVAGVALLGRRFRAGVA